MKINKQHREQFIADVRRAGFDDPFLEQHYNLVVQEGMENYRLGETLVFDNSRMLYQLDIQADEQGFPFLHGYQAALLKTHPITHSVFEGVDTRSLEIDMKAVDWNNQLDELPKVFSQIMQLKASGDSEATDIAERLEARYWTGTAAGRHLQLDYLKERFGQVHYFEATGGIGNINSRQAFNLLSGRHLVRFEQIQSGSYTGYWFGLKPLDPEALPGEHKQFSEERYDGFDLVAVLRNLRITEMDDRRKSFILIRQLIEGDATPATIMSEGKEIQIRLTVDAAQALLNTLDDQGNTVPLRQFPDEKNSVLPVAEKKLQKRKRGKGNGI